MTFRAISRQGHYLRRQSRHQLDATSRSRVGAADRASEFRKSAQLEVAVLEQIRGVSDPT
jgi:hypothetical protein